MASVRPKTVVQYDLEGECVTHARTDVRTRGVQVTIDEPAERGGTDAGPTPTETLVAALIGCTNVIARRVGEAHGVHLEDMHVDAQAEFDRRGVMLQEEIDVPFPKVKLTIRAKSDADEAALEKVKADLARFCPVSKVFRQAGTEIEEVWQISRP